MMPVSCQAEAFVNRVAALRFADVFNPYAETCCEYDQRDAPAIRRRNLGITIDAAMNCGVDSLWIARDLGYRGGRRTGLALTDENHLRAHAQLLNAEPLSRATKGPIMGERTATVIWQALHAIQRPVFLWNVFPLHPHAPGDQLTNRCHSKVERLACRPLLMWLLETLQPKSILAIGRDAQAALADLDVPAKQIRHPSYGGQPEFLSAVYDHYRVQRPAQQSEPLLL